MNMKECTRCKTTKRVSEFYWRPDWNDCYSWCKSCSREYSRKYRDDPVRESRQREVDREYQRKKRKENPEWKLADTLAYMKKYPEKTNARRKVAYAVKLGKLQKEPCRDCGKEYVHAHHPDYSKPLDVIWLCAVHHKLEHIKK